MWQRRYSNLFYPFEIQNYVGFNGVGVLGCFKHLVHKKFPTYTNAKPSNFIPINTIMTICRAKFCKTSVLRP